MKQKLFFIVVVLLNMHAFSAFSAALYNNKPRVSIITSIYNGDEFIAGFLSDIVQQTIFNECELILINAHSPGNEEPLIYEYMEQYPNIVYKKLEHDPGLYAVWNMGVRLARADFITNANLDDRRNPESLAMHVQALEQDSSVDLVYSDYRVTNSPNETFRENTSQYTVSPCDFSRNRMHKCLPGPQPMWRKDFHTKYGYFDESFKSAGDFEMWNRAVSQGAKFKYVPGLSGLYYHNPDGLSTDVRKKKIQDEELQRVVEYYRSMWEGVPQYFSTASDSYSFNALLNLIGSIHDTNFDQLGEIIVFDLGLEEQQLRRLENIEKLTVQKLEATQADLLQYVAINNAGKMAQGWSAWKFVALKQAIERYPYVLWIDSDFTIMKNLDSLFRYIKDVGYFLCTIGDELNENNVENCFKHPIGWEATQYVQKTFNLLSPENKHVLMQEPVLSGLVGVSREALDELVLPLYDFTKNLRLFQDDGTAQEGFGSGRSEQTVLSVFAYLNGFKIHKQDYTQKNPIQLKHDMGTDCFCLTWNRAFLNRDTAIYHSRGDLSNYTHNAHAVRVKHLEDNAVNPSIQTPKIVALVPGRNESTFLYQHLKALSLYVDAIVYLDDASTDDSLRLIESIAAECKVEKVIKKDVWLRDEPGDRNKLLEAGRSIGGTHFLVIDLDEMITANSLENNFLRNAILCLEPGDQMCLVWIQLWRSIDQYRFDESVWTWNYKNCIFCDDRECSYSSGFLHTSRSPGNLKGKIYCIKNYEHGLMHFQFVNWRNLLIKQSWYRCLEHIRNPLKPIEDINALYEPSKNESGLRTVKAPSKWFANYAFFDSTLYEKNEIWRETQVLSWFDEYGKNFFAGLDIWDIDWGAGLSHAQSVCVEKSKDIAVNL